MSELDDLINGALANALKNAENGTDGPQETQPGHERSWQPVDLSAVLSGDWQRPEPTVGARHDGVGLFYPGKVHTVSSETEAGKTWFALSAVLDELGRGHHVIYLDFEDDEGSIVRRLLDLQASAETIAERFHYLRPGTALGTGINLDDLTTTITEHPDTTLAVLDGVTEAMALHGLNPLDNKDIATFSALLPRRITQHGPAVVCLDHVVKNADNRGRYSLGGVHKLNALDGAGYLLNLKEPFGIGLTGRSEVVGSKDRHGQLRRHGYARGEGQFYFADLVLTSHYEGFAEVTVEAPQERDEDWRPTVLMERIAEELGKHEMPSQRMVRTKIKGKESALIAALDYLILDGYVSPKPPYRLLRTYP